MLLHHFKIAWRNLRARKVYAFINIIGLTVGIATSLLIFLVISYELSYDDFQSRNSRIHRVVIDHSNKSNGEITDRQSSIPVPLPNALRTDFPQLEKVGVPSSTSFPRSYLPSFLPSLKFFLHKLHMYLSLLLSFLPSFINFLPP